MACSIATKGGENIIFSEYHSHDTCYVCLKFSCDLVVSMFMWPAGYCLFLNFASLSHAWCLFSHVADSTARWLLTRRRAWMAPVVHRQELCRVFLQSIGGPKVSVEYFYRV